MESLRAPRGAAVSSRGQHLQFIAAILVAAYMLLAGAAGADELDDEVRQIAKQLQCPICESVSVADSPSELAGQMRAVIRRKLEQGESTEQIVAYFVERYGDAVRTEPPRTGFTLAVWLGPALVLLGGVVVLGFLLRTWVRPPRQSIDPSTPTAVVTNGTSPRSTPPPDSSHLERARRELEAFGGRG